MQRVLRRARQQLGHRLQMGAYGVAIGQVALLFREVQLHLQLAQRIQQPLADRLDHGRHGAVQAGARAAQGGVGRAADQVGHGLRLREVEPA